MKRTACIACLAVGLWLTEPLFGQTPIDKDQEQVNALIKELRTQQNTIAENQAKIEEKLATLGETIRQAKIYSSRGGR